MVRRKIVRKKVPGITMATHPDFYRKYEEEREKLKSTTGIDLSHKAFTQMMSKVNIDFSKIGNNILNGKKPVKKKFIKR